MLAFFYIITVLTSPTRLRKHKNSSKEGFYVEVKDKESNGILHNMKIKILGLAFLLLGTISLFVQKMFYGYVDVNGVLHDSVFLPLGVFLVSVGVLVVVSLYIFNFLKKL